LALSAAVSWAVKPSPVHKVPQRAGNCRINFDQEPFVGPVPNKLPRLPRALRRYCLSFGTKTGRKCC
jgi:hypothetical protein